MKFIDVKTTKGEFKVFDLIDKFQLINKHFIESGAIQVLKATEDECNSIVDDYCIKYKDSIECLKGLIISKGIEITNNTYIFKV